MTPELVATLRSAIAENDSHSQKIRRATERLNGTVPFVSTTFLNLDDETIAAVDQLIYRFTKMQDSLGTRFFPALFNLLENDDRPRPFLDILNRLEQLGVIENVDTWQYFRNLRNRLAHDYPESIEQTVQTLNLLYSEREIFLGLYGRAREVCLARLP